MKHFLPARQPLLATRALNKTRCDLLERLGQEEALLHIVVGGVGGVDVLHPGEAPAHPAVLIDGLEEETGWEGREGREHRRQNQFSNEDEIKGTQTQKETKGEGQRQTAAANGKHHSNKLSKAGSDSFLCL